MKVNKGMVSVPSMTLNALKGLLFSSENGVDLTNIINDLAVEDAQKDLVAIHVALVHKGIQPEIDTATRYEHSWGKKFYKYEYVKHSLILGSVTVRKSECFINEHGDLAVERDYSEVCVYPFDRWMDMTTNVKDLLQKLQ